MKKSLLTFGALALLAAGLEAQTVVINEDFESYSAGDPIALSSTFFETWSGGGEGTTEDPTVTDELAAGGSNSLLLEASAVAGGPADAIVPLGLTSGSYEVSFDILIADASGGYFNFQETANPGDAWVTDVIFANGTYDFIVDPGGAATNGGTGSYTSGEWLNIKARFYMESDVIEFWVNNNLVGSNSYGGNLGGINFFAYGGGGIIGKYYVDNLVVTDNSALAIEETTVEEFSLMLSPNPCMNEVSLDFGQARSEVFVEIISLTGGVVAEETLFNTQQKKMDVTNLETGIYFVRVSHQGNVLTKRLVIR